MANKSLVNWLGQQRVDVTDLRAIESGIIYDFKSLIQCFVGDNPYILNGFTIPVSGISGPATALQMVVDSSVVWLPDDANGAFLRVPSGTANEILSPSNPNVVGSFGPGANFVSIQFNRATDPTTNDLVSLWDVDSQTEFTQTAPRGLVMDYQIVINGSSFGNNAPVAIVNVSGSNVTSIKNCKTGLFRLGSGGANPDINNTKIISVDPENSILATSNASPDPFAGGDWEFKNFKDWADRVMTEFKLLKGSVFWYGNNSNIPDTSLADLFFDTAGSKITGAGAWIHSDITPGNLIWTSTVNIRSVFGLMNLTIPANNVTLNDQDVAYLNLVRNQDFQPTNAFTFVASSTSVSASLVVTGIAAGDYIKYVGDNLSAWTLVDNVSGTTITLANPYPGSSSSGKALRTQGSYTMQVASPNSVPVSGNTYWIAKRDDNAFTALTIEAAGSNGLTRTSDVSTLITTTNHGLVAGQSIAVSGASDSTFDGTFDIASIVNPTTITYYNPGSDVTAGSAGNGSVSSVPKIYLRNGGSGELQQGEEIQIDDETTLNILKFIGAENETDTTPPYTIFPNGYSTHDFTSNDNLTKAISQVTGNVNDIFNTLNAAAYDEPLVVVSGAPASSNEVTGPVTSGATLTLPLHSRASEAVQDYTVGKGWLSVYLNGQVLTLGTYFSGTLNNGWSEVGSPGSSSNEIVINQNLAVGDVLTFRLAAPGGPAGSSAPAGDFHTLPSSVSTAGADEVAIWDSGVSAYRKETRANFLSGLGTSFSVNTYASDQTIAADSLNRGNATGGNINFTLPASSSCVGHQVLIKKIDGTANTVTILAAGSDTIDGSASVVLNTQYQARTLVSTGTGWDIV